MKDGFIKVCAATPKIKVADTEFNGDAIIGMIRECEEKKVKLVVFPELCVTGYTCGDLFLQNILLEGARKQLFRIAAATKGLDVLVVVGLPVVREGKLYNVGAVIKDGKLLGLVPKTNLPNYSEFYEARHFAPGNIIPEWIYMEEIRGKVPFGRNILFVCDNFPDFTVALDICEDLWVAIPPSSIHAQHGATVIANLSASDEIVGKGDYRRELVKGQSARLVCGYVYADAGEGESTTDLVFGGHNLIGENGALLKESKPFQEESIISEIDIDKLISERRRMSTFLNYPAKDTEYVKVSFSYQQLEFCVLTRRIDCFPFIPKKREDCDKRCEEILSIQAMGLKKRFVHTNSKCAVIGVSGGLDSTLALLVICKTFDLLSYDRKNIVAVTMPCFGTTDRTYQNAIELARQLGVSLREIPISQAVLVHLEDIGHDIEEQNALYENAQARMRTLVLMDVANQKNGLVIGTGDMSELALGWATYNGDHMSMYGVNASIPKTLIRYLVSYLAEISSKENLKKVLLDILDTPVSPELLPSKEGVISQKTEELVGPYELHDFFLYYVLRFGFKPSKVFRMALYAFEEKYSKETVYQWLGAFYSRFFSQQFKRSCLPDGPKVGSISVSPRGDLRMPSDGSVKLWMEDLKKLEEQEWH